jgi:hypothetical protein
MGACGMRIYESTTTLNHGHRGDRSFTPKSKILWASCSVPMTPKSCQVGISACKLRLYLPEHLD